jgi:hypothetical protein
MLNILFFNYYLNENLTITIISILKKQNIIQAVVKTKNYTEKTFNTSLAYLTDLLI